MNASPEGAQAPRPDAAAKESGDSSLHVREMEELRQELSRIRSDLAALTAGPTGSRALSRPGLRRSRLALPLLAAAVLAVSAQTASPELEKRISALEQLVRSTGGRRTQISAPFDVVGPGGHVIMSVSTGISQAPVSIWREAGGGQISVSAPGGAPRAAMGVGRSGEGFVSAADEKGIFRALVNGRGALVVFDESQNQAASVMGVKGRGRVAVWQTNRKVAMLEVDDAGAGTVKIMDTSGKVLAGMLGTSGTGTVAVADARGTTVAEMTGSGRGAFQIFNGGPALAVLTLGETGGGLLQISNSAGVGVASFTAGGGGAGYVQLLSSSGTPTVEAGTLPNGNGTVRVGPVYKCSPMQAATPVMSFGLPDCIVGRDK